MTTVLRQTHEAQQGDVIAYTIGEAGAVAFDVAVAAGENTVPDTSTARALLAGEMVVLEGALTFDGADAVLNFTLPQDLWPLRDQRFFLLHVDGGVNTVATCVILAVDGTVAITPTAAFAAADVLHLSGSYVRA